MIYTDGKHLVADTISELHAFAWDKLKLKKSFFQTESWPHYKVWGSVLRAAEQNGAQKITQVELVKRAMNLFPQLMPKNLYKEGFQIHKGTPIDFTSLRTLRFYIREHWMPGKRLHKAQNSAKLAQIISNNLDTEVANGDLIAAAILEGYKIEASHVVALFYLSTE